MHDSSAVSLDKEHPKYSDHRFPSAVFSLSAVIDVECVIYKQALIFFFWNIQQTFAVNGSEK